MTRISTRLVLLSAESQSIDVMTSTELPAGLPIVVVCWQTPSPETAQALGQCTVVDLSLRPIPVSERLLRVTGMMALDRLLGRTAAGRLLASFGPAHRSRRFSARVRRSVEWQPQRGDALVALDLAATRAAWFAQRATPDVTATFGLSAALARLG
jgi:hypothetical protein